MLKAPWTEDQINSLNAFQVSGCYHPFTCGDCRKDLIAAADGWHCSCGYSQDWAHKIMADWSWKRHLPTLSK